ncbi:hypothetical protein [Millisia brevis]|uniref:hypothetical protein n=1 Tax=Millisia brevis TaxID=264148 RepID=UPI00082F184F|nr:hypothetical protein [Millisia brevis]
MVVLVLVLAGLGFVLLITALITGQTLFAWACIVACIVGALVLLFTTLMSSRSASAEQVAGEPGDDGI